MNYSFCGHYRLAALCLVLLASVLMTSPVRAADCSAINILLNSQAAIDNFQTNYGPCDNVTGYLYIQGAGIANVDGLSALTSVGSFMIIADNADLTNVDGLSALTSVGGNLQITNNAVLTNLDGLSALASVGGYLYIGGNAVLTDLDGLSALTSVGGFMTIADNADLTNVDGLSALTSVGGSLQISNNADLTNLDGLSALISVGTNVLLVINPQLAMCFGLAALLDDVDDGAPGPGPGPAGIPDVGGTVTLSNNLPGCNSVAQIFPADLDISKAGLPATVVAGTQLVYTVTATNNGPNEATNVTISDFTPTGTTMVDLDDNSPGLVNCTWPVEGDTGEVTCTWPSVASGESIFIEFTVKVDPDRADGSQLSNTASVSSGSYDPDESDNQTEPYLTDVIRESAISITKTADPSPLVAQGGTQTYTIEVINGGPSDASNLFVTETLPAGLTVTAMNPPAICNGTSGTVICDVGTVAANDSFVFTLELAIPDNFGLGTITNIARVECTDAACSTNTTPEESAVQAEAQTRVVVAVPADGTALIAVQKFFTDGNDETPVTLTLACKTGSYVPASVTVNPDDFAPGSAFEQIFIVSNIPTGVPNPCTVVEEPVAGYDATYICGQDGSTSTVDDTLCNGFADFTPGTTACGWLDVATGASNLCGIFNNPAPVEVAVTKVWDVVSNTGGDSYSFDTEITIGCNAEILNSSWETGSWSYKQFFLTDGDYTDGMATVTVQVIPDYPSSECYAYESDVESAVEVTSDCGDGEDTGMEVSVGMGDSCTITNTLFFEGIPTLNQYGMALLALLMLGIGMVGFRRFA